MSATCPVTDTDTHRHTDSIVCTAWWKLVPTSALSISELSVAGARLNYHSAGRVTEPSTDPALDFCSSAKRHSRSIKQPGQVLENGSLKGATQGAYFALTFVYKRKKVGGRGCRYYSSMQVKRETAKLALQMIFDRGLKLIAGAAEV